MREVLAVLIGLAEELAEGLAWWHDWRRTWSPVSFWLALIVFAGLLAVMLMMAFGG